MHKGLRLVDLNNYLNIVYIRSIDIEVIRTVLILIFFHEENSKHLNNKQKASK